MRWNITEKDVEEYAKERLDRPSSRALKAYYRGLGPRETHMFENEIKDLEKIYTKKIWEIDERLENTLPNLLFFMKEFIDTHAEKDMVQEKLDALTIKKECKHEQTISDDG